MRIQDFVGQLLNTYTHSSWYPGRQELSLAIKRGLEYRRCFANLSEQEQNQAALKSLQEIVAYARRTVPYYADKLRGLPTDFPQSLADYRALEPLDKATIRAKKSDLLSQEFAAAQLIPCSTSGSTGEPTTVYSTQQDVGWRLSGEQYYYSLLGSPRGKRVGKLYGGEVEISKNFSSFRQLKDWAFNRLHYDCLKLDEEYLLKVHAKFTRFAPEIIIAYSSAIYLLALTLERNHLRPTYPRRAILCAAERLESYQRAVVERVFAAPVVERYGSRDIGQMAYQLPGHNLDFQVDRSYCLIEPDGQPDENGCAPLLVTTLRNRAMPLLRYRIEDLACFPLHWTSDQAVSSLTEIVGRTCDYILLPGNKKVSGGMMDILFQDKGVNAYQVVQYADASVCVKIVPGPQFNGAEMQRLIRAHLAGVAVEFEYPAELARTTAHAKLRPVISHLALPISIPDRQYLASDVFSAP
jgi:phenylacetate-CoA ligase